MDVAYIQGAAAFVISLQGFSKSPTMAPRLQYSVAGGVNSQCSDLAQDPDV